MDRDRRGAGRTRNEFEVAFQPIDRIMIPHSRRWSEDGEGKALRYVLLTLAFCLGEQASLAAENLIRNGSFEQDADGDDVPDSWRAAGDHHVTQRLRLDAGRDDGRAARLQCTEFTDVGPASQAMIAQRGVPVRRGQQYRVTLWARAEDLEAGMVSIALADTSVWTNCGLQGAFAPGPEWQKYEFIFRANRDCGEASRFQMWFSSTGTLWLDDVRFEKAGYELFRPTCRFLGRLKLGAGMRGYHFRDGGRHIGVIWSVAGAKPRWVEVHSERLKIWDIMGRPRAQRRFTPSESPVYIVGDTPLESSLEVVEE